MGTPLDNLAAIFDGQEGTPPYTSTKTPEEELKNPQDAIIKSDSSPLRAQDTQAVEKKRRASNWDKPSPPRQPIPKESKFSDQPPKEAPPSNLGARPASSRFSEQPPVVKKSPPEHTNFSQTKSGPQQDRASEDLKSEEGGNFIYLLGVPMSTNGAMLKQKLMEHFDLKEDDFNKTVTPYSQKNNNEQSCNYLRLQIANRATVNKMIMNPTFTIQNHPVLLLPEIADVPLVELINLHQTTFQPQNTQRAPYGGNPDEIAAIYRFVSKFGNVVDMNMERWPHHCLVTYASIATSEYLIKLKNVQYKNYKGYTVRLHTSTSPVYDANSVRNPIDLTDPFDPAKVYRIRSKNLQDKRTFPPPPN